MASLIKRLKFSKTIESGIWYTAGNFFLNGLGFITIPLFTRLLNTNQYGIVNTYNSWLAVFTIFTGLSLQGSIANAKYEFKEDFNSYLSSVLFLSTVSFIAVTVLVNLILMINSKIFSFSKFLMDIMLIQSYASFVILYINSKFNIEYKYKKYFFISVGSTLLNIILSIYFIIYVFTGEPYLGRIMGGVIASLLFGIFTYAVIIFRGKKIFSLKYWKYALKISVPLIPHSLSGIILAQADRIMINYYIGSAEVGIYSLTYNIGTILGVVWGSFNSAWVPWFYDKMSRNHHLEIKEKSKYYILIFTIITICLMFVSPEIFKILAPKEYWVGIGIVPPILIANYFNFLYSLPANIEFYFKKTGFISFSTIISAVVNIILNKIFLPIYGYEAAAYTTLVSYVLLFILHWLLVTYILKVRIFRLKYFISSIIAVSFASIIFMLLNKHILIRYLLVLIFLLLIYKKYKDKLKFIGGSI